jgi:hypothetical protein
MADGFSIGGSVVGVVSLTIEACKGIVWYTTNVKEAKDKTSKVREQMESLADLLEVLETVIGQRDPTTCSESVRTEIIACKDALTKIKDKLPIQTYNGKNLQRLKYRLLFPFKQDGILWCKEVAESIQLNLNTALHILET